ncbi:glycosyltransferase family 4 protein [Maribacter sp. 2307UL18-2]|uniref:glycosyltransferase family 4 protein n=1 Tax=Maribacter sp. 2307UL18-2 TaxID=3386274 RepID=UPI0039BC266D
MANEFRMNVVHIISTLNIGGAENFVVQLANKQVEYCKVTIVSLRCTDDHENYKAALRSEIGHVELDWKPKYNPNQLWQLNKLINKIAPFVIHVHLHNPFYYVFALSFFKRKIKYIHTIHSSFDNWKNVLAIVYKLRRLNNNILHVALSRTIAKSIEEEFPKLRVATVANGIKSHVIQRKNEEIKKIWNGFDISPKEGFRFLAIGNISDNKNYKLLALSFKALAEEYPDAMCIQAGRPTDKVLTQELKEINASNVFLAGPMCNAADLLTEADALVISSIQEGMPIVALEAMSMGVPIITTPAGGMPDIVSTATGLIANNFEVTSFKNTLTKFIQLSHNKKRALATSAKKLFKERYDINIAEQHYKIHYELE